MCFIFLCSSREQDCQDLVVLHKFLLSWLPCCGFALAGAPRSHWGAVWAGVCLQWCHTEVPCWGALQEVWEIRQMEAEGIQTVFKNQVGMDFCNAYVENKCCLWLFCNATRTTEKCSKWLKSGESFNCYLFDFNESQFDVLNEIYIYSCCFHPLDLKACYKRVIAKQTFYFWCRSVIRHF